MHTHLEEGDALQHAGGAAHLSDGVHGELRRSQIQHRDAEAGGQDGPDGGATRAVVPDHHVLQEEGADGGNLPWFHLFPSFTPVFSCSFIFNHFKLGTDHC